MELLGRADKGSSENMFVSISRGSFSFCLQGAFGRMFVRLQKFEALTLQDFSVERIHNDCLLLPLFISAFLP